MGARPLEKPPELVAFEAAKEAMDAVRAKHNHLISVLEVIMTDIGAVLAPCISANGNALSRSLIYGRIYISLQWTNTVRLLKGLQQFIWRAQALLWTTRHAVSR